MNARRRILPPLVSRFTRLPIRWRLAVTSALLTFLILATFGVVIGLFAARQVRGNFDGDLRATTGDLQNRIRVRSGLTGPQLAVPPDTVRAAAVGGAVVRVLRADGSVWITTDRSAALGPPTATPHNAGGYRTMSRPIFIPESDRPIAFVQYAKPRDSVKGTISRIRLFLAAGVFGGALLALLAGLAVARRAMDPVQRLTRAAKEIARTRDATVSLPKPDADDEVADLARTLDEMLAELHAVRTELESILARQREFVADASHELRTPLTSILANLELLEAELRGEDQEVVQSALRSSRRMRGLVSDLLLLARADARRERAREPADIGAVVRAAAGEAAPLAAGHDLAVDVPDGVVVDGWPDDLHRMALNLIENALRHTPPGTAVRVGAHQPDEGHVTLVVEDQGPGLPPEIRGRAFERFVRGAGDGGRGSGLGLAIVSAVADGHGGSVRYEDRLNGGARFIVTLPARLAAPTPPRRRAGSSAGA